MRVNFAKAHKRLWKWLADNPGRKKEEWLEWRNMPCVDHYCFACEAALVITIGGCAAYSQKCLFCPIGECSDIFGVWGGETYDYRQGSNCCCIDTIEETAKRIEGAAKRIATMKWEGRQIYTHNKNTGKWEV